MPGQISVRPHRLVRQVRGRAKLPQWFSEETLACQAGDQGSSPGVANPENPLKIFKICENRGSGDASAFLTWPPYRFWYAPYRYRYAVRRVVCSFLLSGILASYLGPLLCLFGPRWGLEPWSRRCKFSSLTMRAYLRLLRRVLCIGCRALGVPILARANIGTLGAP